jgi:serine/threonine protein kinase
MGGGGSKSRKVAAGAADGGGADGAGHRPGKHTVKAAAWMVGGTMAKGTDAKAHVVVAEEVAENFASRIAGEAADTVTDELAASWHLDRKKMGKVSPSKRRISGLPAPAGAAAAAAAAAATAAATTAAATTAAAAAAATAPTTTITAATAANAAANAGGTTATTPAANDGGSGGEATATADATAVVETSDATAVEEPDGEVSSINQYSLKHELGRGAFGVVRMAVQDEGTARACEVAVKILDKRALKRKRVGRFGNALQGVQREVAIWKKLDNVHCVNLFEVIDHDEGGKVYMVSELVCGGAVMPDELHVAPLPLRRARHYFRQLLRAVQYLHFNHIAHRDIKPGNLLVLDVEDQITDMRQRARDAAEGAAQEVLGGARIETSGAGVSAEIEEAARSAARAAAAAAELKAMESFDEEGLVKLTDFGVSEAFGDSDVKHNTVGTAVFFAPEMCSGQSDFSAMECDLWACGITLYMFVYGHPPFHGKTIFEVYEKIQTGELPLPPLPTEGFAPSPHARRREKEEREQAAAVAAPPLVVVAATADAAAAAAAVAVATSTSVTVGVAAVDSATDTASVVPTPTSTAACYCYCSGCCCCHRCWYCCYPWCFFRCGYRYRYCHWWGYCCCCCCCCWCRCLCCCRCCLR